MLEFLSENLATVAVAAVLAAIVILIVVRMVRDRKKGGCSFGSACSCCPNAGSCHANTKPSQNR